MILHKKNSARHSESGVSITELAIVLPVLVILITGIIDVGIGLRDIQVVTDAARNSALRASRSILTRPNLVADPPQCTSENISTSISEFTDCTEKSVANLTRIQTSAWTEACHYLDETGLDKSMWRIGVRVANELEDNQAVGLVTVRIEAVEDRQNCFFCATPFAITELPRSAFTREKTYPLTIPCS